MIRGLYTAAFGMIENQTRQDVTANNIANSETTGYKEDKIVDREFPEVMLQNEYSNGLGRDVHRLGSMPLGVTGEGPYTDFKQGASVETGRKLDFAIEGRGFFPVRYFDGITDSIKYTRDGSFNLDGEGNVVTSEGGFPLARDAATGEIVPMKLAGNEIKVDSHGNVFVDSQLKYTLVIDDFNDYNSLSKYGKNMYDIKQGSGAAAYEITDGTSQVVQGRLEQSNVDMNSQITDMIVNLRRYQANQRVLNSIDETLDKTINEVGTVK
jgi:flagellar basal-body rod protein FlgF